MIQKKHKLILFLFFVLILVSEANFVLALEIQYPPLPFPDVKPPQEFLKTAAPGEILPLYIKYFYHFFIMIAGLIAFGAIVYGGFQYLISAGSPVKMTAAREQITGGILGLIILLSSYLILAVINPQLTIWRPTLPALEKKTATPSYGLYLYPEENYGGEPKIVAKDILDLKDFLKFSPKSLKFFSVKDGKVEIWQDGEEGVLEVTIYSEKNLRGDKSEKYAKNIPSFAFEPKSIAFRFLSGKIDYQEIPIGTLIEKKVLDEEKLNKVNETSKRIKDVGERLKNASQELKTLTNLCWWTEVDGEPVCKCAPEYYQQIQEKAGRVTALAGELENLSTQLNQTLIDYRKETVKLENAEILMRACPFQAISFDQMNYYRNQLGEKIKINKFCEEGVGIVGVGGACSKYVEFDDDPAAFYCLGLDLKEIAAKFLRPTGPIFPSPPLVATACETCEIPLDDTEVMPYSGAFGWAKATYPDQLGALNELTEDNWNYVIQKSKGNGWNPVVLLAIWGEESHFSTNPASKSVLGCAPNRPDLYGIRKQLDCFFGEYGRADERKYGCQDGRTELCALLRYYAGGGGCSFEAPDDNRTFFPDVLEKYKYLLGPDPQKGAPVGCELRIGPSPSPPPDIPPGYQYIGIDPEKIPRVCQNNYGNFCDIYPTASLGCLLTSVSMVSKYWNVDPDPTGVGNLNNVCSLCGWGGCWIQAGLDACRALGLTSHFVFNLEELISHLSEGHPIIILTTQYSGHFVVIYGAAGPPGGEIEYFYIRDPCCGVTEWTRVSVRGGILDGFGGLGAGIAFTVYAPY